MADLVTQQTFIRMMSNRLEKFKKVGSDTWNFRCPICGDSQTNSHKARGYFIRKQDKMMFFCHNQCGGMSFPNFLKRFDSTLHDQYLLQRYKKREDDVPEEPVEQFKAPPFLETLNQYFQPMAEEATRYLQGRKIPMENWFYAGLRQGTTSDIALFTKEVLGKELGPTGNDLRIIFPFADSDGGLVGVSGRAIGDHKLRFVTAMPSAHDKAAFLLHSVDMTRDVYVLEGQMDCLLIDNSISPGGLSKFPFVDVPKEARVFVVDNQPRLKDVIKMTQRLIDDDERVVIWPEGMEEKDPNDMVKAGLDPMRIIQERTFRGLKAQLEFTRWKKV